MNKINSIVIPIAGLGTRFLPITKAIPKEMLGVLDRPLIDYAVEEARNAGIKKFIFITNKENNYPLIYFTKNKKLEKILKSKNRTNILNNLKKLNINKKDIHIIYQDEPKGLGDAILKARHILKNEDFAVILPDDLILGENCLAQMVKIYKKEQSSVIGAMRVSKKDVDKYGIIKLKNIKKKPMTIEKLEEKPKIGKASSNLAVVGRYILKSSIFKNLKKIKIGKGKEIQLTDALSSSCIREKVLAYKFNGDRFDCGSKLGYVEAQIAFALNDKNIKEDIKKIIIKTVKKIKEKDI